MTAAPGVEVRRAAASAPLAWLRERGMGASILVAAISSAFGVLLISATGYIAAMLRADPYIGDSGMLAFVLSFLTVLLVGVAVYVAAIVTANTFSTVIAGRTRRIALLRLIGASARAQRAEVARQGLVVGVIGAFLGLVGRHGGRGGRCVARRPDAGARRDRLHPGAAAAADPRRDRRAHHLGGSVGRIAPRARGDAAAGAGRLGRGLPRPGLRPHGPQRRGDRAVRRGRGAAGRRRRARAAVAARRGRGVRRRHPVVHRARARRHARDAAGAAARRRVCSAARRPRGWRPRTRCATRSARRAWRSES